MPKKLLNKSETQRKSLEKARAKRHEDPTLEVTEEAVVENDSESDDEEFTAEFHDIQVQLEEMQKNQQKIGPGVKRIVKNLKMQVNYRKRQHEIFKLYSMGLQTEIAEKEAIISSKEEDIESIEEELERTINNIVSLEDQLEQERNKYEKLQEDVEKLKKIRKNYNQVVRRRSKDATTSGRPVEDFCTLTPSGQQKAIDKLYQTLLDKYGGNKEPAQELLLRTAKKIMPQEFHGISKLTVMETMYIWNRLGISFNQRRKLISHLSKIDKNIFASEYLCRKTAKDLCEGIEIITREVDVGRVEAPEPILVTQVANVEKVLQKRLMYLFKSGLFISMPTPDNEVWICPLSDKGGDYCKLGLLMANRPSLVSSVDNLTILGVFKSAESLKTIHACFKNLAEQINDLTQLKIEETIWKIRKFPAGDFKLLSIVGGLQGASSRHPCLKCLAPQLPLFKDFHAFHAVQYPLRTEEHIPLVDEKGMSKTRPSLFNAPFQQYVLPYLHIELSLGNKLIRILELEVYRFDGEYLTEYELKTLCHKYEEDYGIGKLRKLLTTTSDELDHKISDNDWVIDVINSVENDEEIGDYDPNHQCKMDGCLVDILKMNLPNREYSTLLQCGNSKCKSKWHSYCLEIDYDASKRYEKESFRCPQCVKRRTCAPENKSRPSRIRKLLELLKEDLTKKNEEIHKMSEKKLDYERDLRAKFIEIEGKLGPENQNLRRIYNKLGVSDHIFMYKFIGNHLRKIILHIEEVFEGLHPDLQINSRVISVKEALILLGMIQDYTGARFLNDEEKEAFINLIDALLQVMIENFPEMKVTPLFHLFFCHSKEYMKLFGNAGLFTEQAIESTHAIWNKNVRRITDRREEIKAERILSWHLERNLFFDSINPDVFLPTKKIPTHSDVEMMSARDPEECISSEFE